MQINKALCAAIAVLAIGAAACSSDPQ